MVVGLREHRAARVHDDRALVLAAGGLHEAEVVRRHAGAFLGRSGAAGPPLRR